MVGYDEFGYDCYSLHAQTCDNAVTLEHENGVQHGRSSHANEFGDFPAKKSLP
jgi:hypothetical protein